MNKSNKKMVAYIRDGVIIGTIFFIVVGYLTPLLMDNSNLNVFDLSKLSNTIMYYVFSIVIGLAMSLSSKFIKKN